MRRFDHCSRAEKQGNTPLLLSYILGVCSFPYLASQKNDEMSMQCPKRPFAVFFASILRQNPNKNQQHAKMGPLQAHSEQDNSKQKVVRYGFSKYS